MTEEQLHRFTLNWNLDAPRSAVYRAWTDPAELGWFYNPAEPIPDEPIELDLRVGGQWRISMVINQDTQYYTGGVYREIVPDESLVFTWGAVDGWPDLDLENLDASPLVTVSLADDGAGTALALTVQLPAHLSEEEARTWLTMGIRDGWRDTVDRLAAVYA